MKTTIKKYFPSVWDHLKLVQKHLQDSSRRKLRKRVESILNRTEKPDTRRAESDFQKLQDSYPDFPPYGYDDYSIWSRGASRAIELLDIPDLKTPRKRILEVGCGDGLVSFWLQNYGHEVILTDMDDWRHERSRNLTFYQMDVNQNWDILGNEPFDLIFSYNSFEHFSDPVHVLLQMKSHLAPGGRIYLHFAPIYCSPWGLHAYRSLKMPYPQYLFSPEFIQSQLEKIGINDLGKQRTTLQYTNQWRVSQYENLWKESGMTIEKINRSYIDDHFDLIARYPECFQGRNLTIEDVSLYLYSLQLKNER